MEPGGQGGMGKLANQRADERFLVFKDAASWLEYQDRFSNGTPFDAMVGHTDMMARDITRSWKFWVRTRRLTTQWH